MTSGSLVLASSVALTCLVARLSLSHAWALSAPSFLFVSGVWIWRGRVRSQWESSGFDSGMFDLFMKMKGANTRLSLLRALSEPRDRLQLAQELGLDWKIVDYHIGLLDRCGLVREDHAFGRVKMYKLTDFGGSLLRLINGLNQGASVRMVGDRDAVRAG